MEWRDIPGYDGRYQASSEGWIRCAGFTTSHGHRIKPREMKLRVRAKDGYVIVNLRKGSNVQTTEKVHRLVAVTFLPGGSDALHVDHINGVRQDNRVSNLRWATNAANQQNRHKANSASGHLGVFRSASKSKPWRATVMVNGKSHYVGSFATAEAAKVARDQKQKELLSV